MSRKVYLRSDMSTHSRMLRACAELREAVYIWPWLLTGLDDWGRAEGAPLQLKLRLFSSMPGISVKKIERALEVFAREGLLLRYTVDGIDYIAMPPEEWFADQTHIRPEKRERDGSHFPPPPQSCLALEDGLNSGLEASAPGDLAAHCCDLHADDADCCELHADRADCMQLLRIVRLLLLPLLLPLLTTQ